MSFPLAGRKARRSLTELCFEATIATDDWAALGISCAKRLLENVLVWSFELILERDCVGLVDPALRTAGNEAVDLATNGEIMGVERRRIAPATWRPVLFLKDQMVALDACILDAVP